MHCEQRARQRLPQGIMHPGQGKGGFGLSNQEPLSSSGKIDQHPPIPSDWNESLTGDFCWTNVNFGEAISAVMTPLTWSLLKIFRKEWTPMQGVPPFGNIGGRIYANISYSITALGMIGKRGKAALEALENTFYLPVQENLNIPVLDLTVTEKLLFMLKSVGDQTKWARMARVLPEFVEDNPAWCRKMRSQITATGDLAELIGLWDRQLEGRSVAAYLGVLSSAMRFTNFTGPVRQGLKRRVGADLAEALLSNISGDSADLSSLDPLVGLQRVANGEMSPEEYLEHNGHRSENEWELSEPRLAENPDWLLPEVAHFRQSNADVGELLANQRRKVEDAWQEMKTRFPGQVGGYQRKIAEVSRRGRLREAARSELVRVLFILRTWALQVGKLADLGDGIFFLSLEEILELASGVERPREKIDDRKARYDQLRSLPAYPALIIGRFDPFQWAAGAHRSSEIFDSRVSFTPSAPKDEIVRGSAGSPGKAQGIVRVAKSLADGQHLQSGEVLVTPLTDIAWTPLFPRAAAIVTDVGAALSHAAIVARELGIPAVVGCGDATVRLKTGDAVFVDGGQGTVRIIQKGSGGSIERATTIN